MALAGECDTLIIVVRNAGLIPAQADLVQSLLALGKPVRDLRRPAALRRRRSGRRPPRPLTTYGEPPCSLEAAAAVMLGEA